MKLNPIISLSLRSYDKVGILFTLVYSLYGIIQYASKIASLNNLNPSPNSTPYIDLVWGAETAVKINDLIEWFIIGEIAYYSLYGIILISIMFLIIQYLKIKTKTFSPKICLITLFLHIFLMSPYIVYVIANRHYFI